MSFDPRLQARLYSQFDRSEKRLQQLDKDPQDPEAAMSALFEESLKLQSSMNASSSLTYFLHERVKVVLNGIQ